MKELIVISNARCFEGEIALVNELFDAGMGLFHLRKPGISFNVHSLLLNGIHPQYRDKVVLHQFHDTGASKGMHRFHFSEADRQHRGLRSTRGKKTTSTSATLSTSIHSLTQSDELSDFDYAFFGPVFDSISKPGYKGLGNFVLPAQLSAKLVALGGITADNIEQVFEMGFDKAAVLGVLFNRPDEALYQFKQLREKCQ